MKTKNLICLFCFLVVYQVSISQSCSSKIIYDFTVSKSYLNYLDKENKKQVLRLYSQINNHSKNLNLFLVFNERESLFYAEEYMVLDNKPDYNLATSFLEADGNTYLGLDKDEKIISKEAYGEYFYITSKLNNIKWSIKKETKEILSYSCLKATGTYKVKNSKGEFEKKVVAWFTPQLPFNFGPSGLCGLPGMILELENKGLIITAKKISLFTEELINFKGQLKKGIKVTNQEFEEYGKKAHKKIKSEGFKF